MLEDRSARARNDEFLIEVQSLEESVRVSLPDLVRVLPRGGEHRRLLLGTNLLLLREHARRQPADECRDEDEERRSRHLRECDAAAAQLDERLDEDKPREHHGDRGGGRGLLVALSLLHEVLRHEGTHHREETVEEAHERHDAKRTRDRPNGRDHERRAVNLGKGKVEDGRGHEDIDCGDGILADIVDDQPLVRYERLFEPARPIASENCRHDGCALLLRGK
mmetsp:Transcript_44220/g.116199  ORF Transcript_44220/g.116199 Transcript_44220/m.116199 type:complete len:222 (+) Transcript_44220:619-1284(+)